MNKKLITTGEFARLCSTSKETLRHYKEIGLLIPRYEGENGYGYYDAEQFYDYYAIAIFKKTGTPLAKIKDCMGHQNISTVLDTLKEQREALAKEKREIEQMQFVVERSIANMGIGLSETSDHVVPQVGYFPKEHLLAVPHDEFHVNKEEADEQVLISVLQTYREVCDQFGVQTDYQLGAIMNYEDRQITSIYTRVNKLHKTPYYRVKPAGDYLYLVYKGRWDLRDAYNAFFTHIDDHGVRIAGEVYAYDLAGFLVNGIEENSMTMISGLIG